MVHQVPTFPSQTLTSKCFLVSHYLIRLRPLPCQLFRILRGLLTSTMQLQDHQHQGDVLTEDGIRLIGLKYAICDPSRHKQENLNQ